MMLRRLVVAATLLLTLGIAAAQTKTEESSESGGAPPVSLTALVNQVIERFPHVEGEVVEVRGKTVTLSVGRRQGVVPGMAVSLIRPGREIRHPKTGELLGRTEEPVGRATVTQVFDTVSTAAFDGAEARTGDRVSAGDGKTRLTLLVFKGGVKDSMVEAVTHELYEGLNAAGRFEVVLGDQIAVWLTQQGVTPEAFLQGKRVADAAGQFKADNILAVALRLVERKPFMDIRLFAQPRPEPALSTALFVPSSIKPRTPGQFSASDRSRVTPERKPRSLLARLLGGEMEAGAYSSGESTIPLKEVARFGFPVIAMDMGIPADRVPRLVISDGDRVFLYRVVNRALEAEWTYSGHHPGRVFSVYLVDVDGDGVPEVVVNRYDVKLGMNSLILAAKNGRPAVLVDDIHSILVGLDATNGGLKQTLWSQDFSPETFFGKRKVERVVLKNGDLVGLGRVPVPESFRATGVTMSNIMGKDARALVYVDEYNRLRITSGPEELWRSSSAVGGGGYLRMELVRYIIRDGVSKFYAAEPTPLSVDLDGDGNEEVVVPQNQLPGMLAVVFRGPAGVRFQQVYSGFEGLITGLGAIPGEDKEPPTLVACVVRFSGLLKTSGESQIIMTTPQE
jgi:hypothetical protein